MKRFMLFMTIIISTFFVFFSIVQASESHSSTVTNKIQYSGGSVISNTANLLLDGRYSSISNSDSNRVRGSYGSDWKVGKVVESDVNYDAIYLKHQSGTTTYTDAWYVIKNAIKYNNKYYDTKTTITKISGSNAVIANKTSQKLTGHLDVRGSVSNNIVDGQIPGQVEITVKIEIFEAGTNNRAYFPDIYVGLLDVDYSGSFYLNEKLTKDNSLIFNTQNVADLMYNSSANSLYSTNSGNTVDIANVYWRSIELKQGILNITYGYRKSAGVYMGFGHIIGLPEKHYASDTPSGKDNSSVKVGDIIKYNINYTNGADSSNAVVVTDLLSKGLEYVASSSSIGEPTITNNSDGTTKLVWNRTLAAKASESFTYSAKVVSGYEDYKVINDAVVKVDIYEYNIDPLENPVLKKGKVITRHLEQGTNRELASQEEITKYYGDSYTTSSKTITNYNYVNSEGNTSGTINQDETVVVYYYKLKQGNLIVHHYETGTTNKLLEDETSVKNYGDSYTTSSKEDSLPYYDFDSSSDNTSGTIDKDETEVTYYYKLKKGQVITKHLEKGTNKQLTEGTTKTYDYGSTYTTSSASVGENYNLDSVSGDVSGEVNKPTTEVIYYYVKKASNIDDEISKTGTEEITKSDALIDYSIKYGAKITDYIGDVEITITDTLPYEIDESASNLAGGTYNRENKTITWKETKENYNSYTEEKISITKNIKVKYTNLDKTKKSMVNEVSGNIKLDNVESTVTDESITRTNIIAKLIVHHYEKGTTKKLLEDETSIKNYGDSYTTLSKEDSLPYYDFDSSSDNTSGTINKDETEVTYYYKLKKGQVITKHLEKGTNKQLAEGTTKTYDYGSTYTTSRSSAIPQNYSYDSVSGDASGEVNKPTTEVVYYYIKKASNIDDEISKTGTDVITNGDSLVDYTIEYSAKIIDYIGDVEITITDTLPYEIDEAASSLAGGTYNRENKTITWKETKNNYNSYTAPIITLNKTISLKFTNIDKTKRSFVNRVRGNIKLDNNESTVTAEKTTRAEFKGTVIVHYYEKGTTTRLLDDVVDTKDYGATYTTSSKESLLPYYDLDSDSGNTSGTINKDETVVIYYYKLKKGNVITKHLEKGTNEVLASSTSNTYNYGETYTTSQSSFVTQNYNLDSVSGDASGKVNKPTTEVIYYYVKKASNIDDEISKTGTEEITKSDVLIDYSIKYGAKITDYIGDVEITITDTLPYEIDESASNLAGGIYNKENKTITWEETKNNYNSYTAEKISITKNIKVKYKNIDKSKKTMVNEVTGNIKLDNGESTITAESITRTNIEAKLIVRHYEKGTSAQLLPDEEYTKNYGDSYSTSSKESTLTNYNLDSNSGNTSGTINKDETVVTYYYKLNKGTVITKHLEKGSNDELAVSTSDEYNYGETYTTRQSTLIPQNYSLDSVSGNTSGEVNKPTTEVIYYYAKKVSNIDDEISKTGTDVITSSNALVDYTIKYGAKITDYIGDVEITITDTLPYEIDESASNLAGGTYNRENKTITWKDKRNNYDSFTAEKISITKNIKIKFINLDKTKKSMVNKVIGNIKLDNGESSVTSELTTRTNIKGNLIVHHYEKGTTTRLLDDVVNTKDYGDTYTTSSKESLLPYYDLDSDSGNTSGTINKDETVVIYYYKLKKGNVITKHLEKETNKELDVASSHTYNYGETYTTNQSSSIAQNYNLDSVSGEVSGEVNKPTTEVIYYYVKKASNIDDEISKTGTEKITSSNALIDYSIKYGAKITDYIGDVEITIRDNLPYEIDESASNLAGGIYNKENKTITWEETKSNYNSYTAEKISITKNIKVKFINIDKAARTMVNEVTGNIKLDNKENSITTEKITKTEIKGTLTAKYVDKDGKEISDKVIQEGLVGEEKSVEAKEIEGYTLVKKPDSEVLTLKEGNTDVVYVYEKIKYNIITKALTEGGTIVGDEIVNHGENSTKKIEITTTEGYYIKNLYINGKKQDIESNLEYLTLPIFKNVTENKLVEVEFEMGEAIVIPNTGSRTFIVGIISGIAMIGAGGYILYRKYKMV